VPPLSIFVPHPGQITSLMGSTFLIGRGGLAAAVI
jgi:hypothetical protein